MVEQSQALVLSPDSQVAPRQQPVPWQDFGGMMTFAEIAHDSGLCPKHIPNWQAALVIMQKSVELAIPPIEGLMGIYMIDGKTVVSSRLLAGLVTRAFGPRALEVIHTDDAKATVRYWRPGMAEARTLDWTIEQARTAGLVGAGDQPKGKDNWRKYPAAMLRARAISAVCSFAFADVIGGLLTPDEIENLPVRVTIDGDVAVDSQALLARQPAPAEPRQAKRIAQASTPAAPPAPNPADVPFGEEEPFPEPRLAPATEAQVAEIARRAQLARTFHRVDPGQNPANLDAGAATVRLSFLAQLLKAPLKAPGLPATDDMVALCMEAGQAVIEAGGTADPSVLPDRLTADGAWRFYQGYRQQLRELSGEVKA